ncbi:hypothetical protein Tco_0481119 [Tanacetum coccineum]
MRLRTNTKTLKDLYSQSLETASQSIHDTVTTHQVTASRHSMTALARTDSNTDLEDSTYDAVIENQLLSASLLICLGKLDCVERIPSNIRPIYDEEPMAEVQMTADDNVSATGQQHTEQPEFNNKGEVDQNAKQCHDIRPLPAKLTEN